MMPHVLYLLLFFLSSTDSVSCSVLFARTGEKVTLQCQCSTSAGCYDQFVRWVKMNSNESLKVINITCQESQCRFASKRLNDDLVALTIRQVEPGDSGRYYCGEHLSSYFKFNGNGSVLKVGDVWMNHSAVHMLMEWMGEGGSPELALNETHTSNSSDELVSEWMNKADANSNSDRSEVPQHTELRCVVTGLSAPWVNILWRSSQESWEKAGQTWSFTDTGRGYRVESRLKIGLKESDWEHEYQNENSYRVQQLDLDKMVDMDEELWCDVQVGVNSTVQSPKFSFLQQTHTDPEWCDKLLYGEIALCALCVCLLTLLLCHCLQHKHKGSEPPATEVSPTSDSYRDVYSGITYAQLDIKKKPRAERKQRQAKNQQEHSLVYSDVRYKHQ